VREMIKNMFTHPKIKLKYELTTNVMGR